MTQPDTSTGKKKPIKKEIENVTDELVESLRISDGHGKRLRSALERFAQEIKRAAMEGGWE